MVHRVGPEMTTAAPTLPRAVSAWNIGGASVGVAPPASPTRQKMLAGSPRHRVFRGFSRAIYGAFVCVGLASWVVMNATFVELGYFLLHFPEGLATSAYTVFAFQTANIYPIFYMWLRPSCSVVSVGSAVWICLVSTLLVCACFTCFWSQTADIDGKEHSLAMLLLSHIGGTISGATNIIFFRYIIAFPPVYASAFMTGELISGVLIGLLGLWQAPYKNPPQLSVSAFYAVAVATILTSIVAFGYLEFHPKSIEEREQMTVDRLHTSVEKYDGTDPTGYEEEAVCTLPDIPKDEPNTLRNEVFLVFWKELLAQAVLAALYYSVLPSLVPFLFARYSSDALAAEYLTFAITSLLIADPLIQLTTSCLRVDCLFVGFCVLLLTVSSAFLLVSTFIPNPPASADHNNGFLLPLILYVFAQSLHSLTQATLALMIKDRAFHPQDTRFACAASHWSSFCIQSGALVGAIAIFPTVLISFWQE
ncbi:hypothetical protein Poli38472_007029 [Pythium oligandrum]|uniref:Uncharacterized protein n=1 Tax=Pythium oligandrum TaxID=41045 RepID=A0A8K1C8Z7_PYTOL|nr:hypothetical protein Poli38472_007029 [Pythium oligandrum]|eukprot:TMW58884.1 hypothetical protein Poli38472_007029 [Pythium oligandrum]